MRKQECFDYSRRALLGASGALALLAALRPLRTFAQASGGKLRIGIIGSGHIGGAIGGLWVKAGHPVLFSSRHPDELKDLLAGLREGGTVRWRTRFTSGVIARDGLRPEELLGAISDTTRATISKASTAPQALALTLGSPEFQRR